MKKRLRKKLQRREFSYHRYDEVGKKIYLTTAERLRTEATMRRIDKLPIKEPFEWTKAHDKFLELDKETPEMAQDIRESLTALFQSLEKLPGGVEANI